SGGAPPRSRSWSRYLPRRTTAEPWAVEAPFQVRIARPLRRRELRADLRAHSRPHRIELRMDLAPDLLEVGAVSLENRSYRVALRRRKAQPLAQEAEHALRSPAASAKRLHRPSTARQVPTPAASARASTCVTSSAVSSRAVSAAHSASPSAASGWSGDHRGSCLTGPPSSRPTAPAACAGRETQPIAR